MESLVTVDDYSPPNHEDKISISGSSNLGMFMPAISMDQFYLDAAKGLGAVERILNSTDEQFQSRNFLLDAVLEFGIPLMSAKPFSPWLRAMNASGFGVFQYPTEFVDFLCQVIPLGIESAIEIGSFRGGSSYILAAVLQRANSMAQLTMVDIEDNLVCFDLFSQKLNLVKAIPSTSADFYARQFDLVFVDGDHTFLGVLRDFANVGRFAKKALAFHDIHAHEFDSEDGGTVRAWNDIKQQLVSTHSILEFSHCPEDSLGIGLALMK